uniref:Uncharacterized protein n=1 Tax=Romanomermis culicivorax TaxID=13658 RepID=A0A915JKB0_ROMCU
MILGHHKSWYSIHDVALSKKAGHNCVLKSEKRDTREKDYGFVNDAGLEMKDILVENSCAFQNV